MAVLRDSLDSLLATGIDLVILAGPVRGRPSEVRAAAEQGVHILLHAPMARNAGEALAMLASCDEAQLKLGVLVRGLEDPVLEQVRQMIATDWLGGVVHVQCLAGEDSLLRQPPRADDPRLLTGTADHPLLQLAAHHVHLAAWLCGRSAQTVTAQATTGFLPLPADGAVATAVLRGGVQCTFAASHLLAVNQFAIHGMDGFVRLAGDRMLLRGRTEFRGSVFDYLEAGRELGLTRADIETACRREAPTTELHSRFARWIDDRDDYPCSGEQAAADMRVFDAMERAMTSGSTETV